MSKKNYSPLEIRDVLSQTYNKGHIDFKEVRATVAYLNEIKAKNVTIANSSLPVKEIEQQIAGNNNVTNVLIKCLLHIEHMGLTKAEQTLDQLLEDGLISEIQCKKSLGWVRYVHHESDRSAARRNRSIGIHMHGLQTKANRMQAKVFHYTKRAS